MRWTLWTIAWTCLLLAGCGGSQMEARRQAETRWDTARNRIHFRLAQDAYDQGKWRLCHDQLGKVLNSPTPFAPAYLLAAKLAMREQKYTEAHDYLEMAAEVAPELAEAWYGKALLAEQGGDLDSALADAVKASELDPSTPEYLVCVAEMEVRNGEPDRALATLRAAGDRFPTHEGVQSALADLSMVQGDYEGASSSLRRLLLAHPDDAEIRGRLGIALSRCGRAEDAIPLLEASVKDADNDQQALWCALGSSYMQLEQYNMSGRVYARLCKSQPDQPDWNFHLAECYAMQNEDKVALEHLEQVIRVAPNHGDARALAGYLYFAHNDLKRAEENLRVAIDRVDDPTLVAVVLTKTLRALGKEKEAEECWAEFGGPVATASQRSPNAAMTVVRPGSMTLTGRSPGEDVRR